MKNTQEGFVIPLIIALVALIAIGGGVYFYNQNGSNNGSRDDREGNFIPSININDLENSTETNISPEMPNENNNVDTDTTKPPVTVNPTTPTEPNEPVFCTMDAMQCSDGSWVGRTGPNCEFVCPVISSFLTQALAEQLVAKKWSDCSSGDCAKVEVSFIADRGNQYLISAIFTEYDDSVSKTKREGLVLFSNGTLVWTDYQPLPNEWRICHPGRGSQVFSTDKCF